MKNKSQYELETEQHFNEVKLMIKNQPLIVRLICWPIYWYFLIEEKIYFWNFKRKVKKILDKTEKLMIKHHHLLKEKS